MRTSHPFPRLRRPAAARRLAFVITLLSFGFARAAAADTAVTGTVVDQSGRPLPRAYVRALDRTGAESAGTFADELGRFRLAAGDDCRLEVSLSGFGTTVASCGAAQVVRVVLPVAPIAETVVVTATRTEAPAGQLGASVTTFTAADLERRQSPMLADLLRASAGATIVRSGGLGTVASLFVRGGESNDNKVLLDGIPLNEPGGTFNFSNITTENLDRVEVVRGAQSALFGSDAVADVVQLFTKRADRSSGRPRAVMSVDGGSFNTLRGSASVSGASGPFDYAFGASRFTTDNQAANNAFRNTVLSTNAGVLLGTNATLRFVGRGEIGHVGTPGATAFGRPDLDAFFDRHEGVGGVAFDQQLTASLRQRASYALAASHQDSTNLILDPPYTPRFENRAAPFEFSDFAFDNGTRLRRHHATYQVDWRLSSDASRGDQLFTVVLDWDGERARLDDRLGASQTEASRNNIGWSVQHQALWRRAFVTLGARVERNDSFGTAAVPRGSVAYVARESSGWVGETKLRASAGLGIKEPTVVQSFSLSPFFLGNPDLEPERSRTVEVGIDQRLGSDRAKIELTWFDNRFMNIISTRTLGFDPFRAEYFNIGLTRARGAELGLEVAPLKALRGRAGYTFLDSEIVESTSPTNVVFQQGQWAFRRPRHSGFAELTWDRRRVTASVNGVVVGRFVDSDFASLEPPIVTNPGYTTWAARAAYRMSPQLTWTAAIDNLTDAGYMEPLGYPALGRALRAGVRLAF